MHGTIRSFWRLAVPRLPRRDNLCQCRRRCLRNQALHHLPEKSDRAPDRTPVIARVEAAGLKPRSAYLPSTNSHHLRHRQRPVFTRCAQPGESTTLAEASHRNVSTAAAANQSGSARRRRRRLDVCSTQDWVMNRLTTISQRRESSAKCSPSAAEVHIRAPCLNGMDLRFLSCVARAPASCVSFSGSCLAVGMQEPGSAMPC
jgi:hypothetical protein